MVDEIFDLYRKEILEVLNERNSAGMDIIPQAKSLPYENRAPIIEHITIKLNNQHLLGKKHGTYFDNAVTFEYVLSFAKSVDKKIFNGDPRYGTEGIYKDAGDTFTVEKGKEWNTKYGNLYNDIIDMISKFTETSRYTPKFMVLSHEAYFSLLKCNEMGISCIKMIEDAGIFPNGRGDIYRLPNSIIPTCCGLIGDSNPNNIERCVQELKDDSMESISEDEGVYSGIYLQKPANMDENNIWNFKLLTRQGLSIHFKDAFLRLENLTKTP